MKKSFSGLVTTLVLVASVTIATPSFAANKAGGSCTKANATTRIGGDKYVCTKNPIVKNAKLTWVWDQCITANKDYLAAQKALSESLAKATAELAKIDADIAKYQATIAVNEAKAVAAETKARRSGHARTWPVDGSHWQPKAICASGCIAELLLCSVCRLVGRRSDVGDVRCEVRAQL